MVLLVPRAQNNAVLADPGFSANQALSRVAVLTSIGVARSLRPLPWQAMCASGLSRQVSDRVSEVFLTLR
jgi:hypothetical protein